MPRRDVFTPHHLILLKGKVFANGRNNSAGIPKNLPKRRMPAVERIGILVLDARVVKSQFFDSSGKLLKKFSRRE
jgi:hypothetical protein